MQQYLQEMLIIQCIYIFVWIRSNVFMYILTPQKI